MHRPALSASSAPRASQRYALVLTRKLSAGDARCRWLSASRHYPCDGWVPFGSGLTNLAIRRTAAGTPPGTVPIFLAADCQPTSELTNLHPLAAFQGWNHMDAMAAALPFSFSMVILHFHVGSECLEHRLPYVYAGSVCREHRLFHVYMHRSA